MAGIWIGLKFLSVKLSIWSVLEECTNPPVFWKKGPGWYTTEPMSGPEVFDFPDGIGPVEVVSVDMQK